MVRLQAVAVFGRFFEIFLLCTVLVAVSFPASFLFRFFVVRALLAPGRGPRGLRSLFLNLSNSALKKSRSLPKRCG